MEQTNHTQRLAMLRPPLTEQVQYQHDIDNSPPAESVALSKSVSIAL